MIVVYKNFFRNKMVNLSAKSVRHFLPNAEFHCLSLYKENQDEYNDQEPLSPEITNFYRQTKYVFNTGRSYDDVSDITSGYAHPENAKVFSEGFNYIHEEFKTTNEKILILTEDHFFTTGEVIKELVDHDFDLAYGIWGRDIDINASILCLRPAALTEIFPISEIGIHPHHEVEHHLGIHITTKVDPDRRYIIKHRLAMNYFGDGIYTNSSETMLKKLIEANIVHSMIIGLVPIGGKGTRLSLPYSKEMIPQKNFNFFNPIVNHLVEKMELAGAEKVVFVHGSDYKDDICKFFNDTKYIHILQEQLGFANVIYDFYNQVSMNKGDVVLFGLPDSVFDGNPFVEMINKSGIVCGLFVTNDRTKVDRLDSTNKTFQIKTEKTEGNQELFWGVLKFDSENISQMINDKVFDQYSEIGAILNKYAKSFVQGKSYLDLGTWENYNRYLSDATSFTNVEIEKKYDASLVDVSDFIEHFSSKPDSINETIKSTDFYYNTNNTNIEFVRYREKSNDPGSIGDLTVKNFNKSQLNRFELTVPLAESAKTHNVLHLLTLLGSKYQFEVTKHCNIYKFHDYTVVFYSFLVNEKEFKIIEIELHTIDFNLLVELENSMSVIKGFDPLNIINKSKFQIIREHLNDPVGHRFK